MGAVSILAAKALILNLNAMYIYIYDVMLFYVMCHVMRGILTFIFYLCDNLHWTISYANINL